VAYLAIIFCSIWHTTLPANTTSLPIVSRLRALSGHGSNPLAKCGSSRLVPSPNYTKKEVFSKYVVPVGKPSHDNFFERRDLQVHILNNPEKKSTLYANVPFNDVTRARAASRVAGHNAFGMVLHHTSGLKPICCECFQRWRRPNRFLGVLLPFLAIDRKAMSAGSTWEVYEQVFCRSRVEISFL